MVKTPSYPGPGSKLGHRLRFWRERRGMSQGQLGAAPGVDMKKSAISGLERGEAKSTLRMVELAHALRIDPHYLATGEGEAEPSGIPSSPIPLQDDPGRALWPFGPMSWAAFRTLMPDPDEKARIEKQLVDTLFAIQETRRARELERDVAAEQRRELDEERAPQKNKA